MTMMTTKLTADVSVVDAFRLLKAGFPVHIAPAPEATDETRLRGGWKDRKGNIHYDRCAFYSEPETAMAVARAFGQDCLFGLYPNSFGNGRVYLLKDLLRHRVLALRYAGNYVSDGEYLFVACLGDELPFEAEVLGSLPADLVLIFVADIRTRLYGQVYADTTEPAPAEPVLPSLLLPQKPQNPYN